MRTPLVLLSLVLLCVSVHAATLNVPAQYPTIQAGIDAAAKGDTVLVAPGTYVENIDFKGKAITVTSEKGAGVTVIDGGNPMNPNYGSVVIFQNGEGLNSVLDGFTIMNGTGTYKPAASGYFGGGIKCKVSSATIRNNIIEWNTVAAGSGGGINCEGGFSVIKNNIIRNNNAAKSGAGIVCAQAANPIITNNDIYGNSTSSYHGGGIAFFFNSTGIVSENTISGNMAMQFGGGIYCETSSPAITNNTISGNVAHGEGGGMLFATNCHPIILGNTVMENTATKYGGGIEIWNGCTISITNNIIANNKTMQISGGGILVSNNCSGAITNNIITGNSAANSGGGLHCEIMCSLTITNTIFWNNSAFTGSEIWIGTIASPSNLTISHSDLKGGKASIFAASGCTLNWQPGMISANPLFVDSANNDFHLTYPSPCKDTGDNSVVTELFDFEGDPRIAFGKVDMGADEFHRHLYYTGDATPGGNVSLKLVGTPTTTTPVALALGVSVLDPPVSVGLGDWYMVTPYIFLVLPGTIPPIGVYPLPGALPATPTTPYTIYGQAVINYKLTNLVEMGVK